MIVVRLMGGMGNQMFQYAAGRSLACRLNTTLEIDLSWYQGGKVSTDTLRTYQLAGFNTVEPLGAIGEGLPLLRNRLVAKVPVLRRILKNRFTAANHRTFGRSTLLVYKEPHFHFDPAFFDLPEDVLLIGYWQSERYFAEITGLIRREFTVSSPLSGANLARARQIQASHSVNLHIRRGDYVRNVVINEFHGVCPLTYYEKAVSRIAEQVPDPEFFVFSDDMAWVAENLRIDFPLHLVENNTIETAIEDLRLMSLCRHHIIANSSFSWWGAWLSKSPDKIVIAPAKWFEVDHLIVEDLFPSGWIRL